MEFPGAIYHVTVRMVGSWVQDRLRLFCDRADYERLIERLAERVDDFDIRLYQFCLMANHFHLVLETPRGNLCRFMHSLTTAYGTYYNLRHGRYGPVTGRYKAKLVQADGYLLALTRYVHLNPVCIGAMRAEPMAERVRSLRRYEWSTYRSYIARTKALDFVQYGPVLALMGGRKAEWARRYRRYVESGLAENDAEFEAAMRESPRSIGDDMFRARIERMHGELAGRCTRIEDVQFRSVMQPLSAEIVLNVAAEVLRVEVDEFSRRRRNSPLRAVAAALLRRHAGLTQRAVADRLGMGTGSAAGRQLRGLPKRLSENRSLKRAMRSAEERLRQMQTSGNNVKS